MSTEKVTLPTGQVVTVQIPAELHVKPTRSAAEAEREIAGRIARSVESELHATLPMRVIRRDEQGRPAAAIEVPAMTAAQQAEIVGNVVARRIFAEAVDQ